MNFHTWNQNDQKFKKEIKSVLIHKIKIQRVTKNKKKIISSSKLLFVPSCSVVSTQNQNKND
jgi:hypothetical protein